MTAISRVGREDDPAVRQAAMAKMRTLYQINQRWNLPGVNAFLLQKQKELTDW